MKRREFIKGVVLSAVTSPCTAIGGAFYEGSVLGEGSPLAGVVVTDGLCCVLTDRQGRFRLPLRSPARFISVTVPSGWRTDRHYHRVSDGAFDFHLERWAPSARKGCSFVQLTDSETTKLDWVPRLKDVAEREDAAFVVHTGDIANKDGMAAHAQGLTAQTVGRPVYYCIGNHDLSGKARGESDFENLFGPCWYSFDAGGVHFVVTPMDQGDNKPSYSPEMVADWLRNDLALVPKGRPVVLFNHMLTYHWSAADGGRKIGGGASAFDIPSACNLVAFVYGHNHLSYFRRRNGVAHIVSSTPNKGGISHDPAQFRAIRVTAGGHVTAKSYYYPESEWPSLRAGAQWETNLGAPVFGASPIFGDGRIFVATLDDDGLGTGAVFALDPADGHIVWKAPMANSVKGSIVCSDGKVFAQDAEGHVRAFSSKDGSVVWRHDLEDKVWRPVEAGLAIDRKSGILFAGCDDRQCALRAETGETVWSGPKGWKDGGEPVNTSPAVGSGVIVSPAQWRGIHANDAMTGEALWFAKDNGEFFCGARPLIEGDRVTVLVDKRLNQYGLRTGKLLRSKEIGVKVEMPTGILRTSGKYMFGSWWGGLLAYDAETLERSWTIPVDLARVVGAAYCGAGGAVSSTPVAIDGKTGVFTAQDGKVRTFALADGKVLRTFETGAPYFASPVVVNGMVCVADFAGSVRAFGIGG